MSRRRAVLAAAVAVLSISTLSPSVAAPGPANPRGCAGDTAGGEWRSYARVLDGHRHQIDETVLSAENVGDLAVAWAHRATDDGAPGNFHATPVIADGCVYLGTNDGTSLALNAETGETVWTYHLEPTAPGLLGTGFVGSPAVVGRTVFFFLSQAGDGVKTGPAVVALNQQTGRPIWGPTVIDVTPGAYTDASIVAFDGVLFLGFNNDEQNVESRGGYAIVDAATGTLLVHRYVVDDETFAGGSSGGSIWATAAVDEAQKYAYVGTSNPTGRVEHDRTNAIIKVDLDRSRPTFGEIVAHNKGTPDELVSGLPTCGALENGGSLSAHALSCTRQDLAFGASPQLLEIHGRPAVGELQKSGVYHAVFTDTMEDAWEARVGHPTFYGNIATPASDGRTIYLAASPPGHLVALDVATGAPRWATVTADVLHFQAMTLANGVLYTVDAAGFLLAFDAATGVPLARRLLSQDNGGDTSAAFSANSASLSVARGRLYVAAGNFIISYALPN